MKTAEQLAREAGLADFGGWTEANIERLIALVRAEAWEEAAKAVETQDTNGDPVSSWFELLAAKIRALSAAKGDEG